MQSNAARLPQVELPRLGRNESIFAQELGTILKDHGVFMYGGAAVAVAPKTDRIEPLTADCFRTFVEQYLHTIKKKRFSTNTQDGKTIIEDRPLQCTMTKAQAEAVLHCHQFLAQLLPVRRVSRIPVPVFRNGEIVLHNSGYDPRTGILVKECK